MKNQTLPNRYIDRKDLVALLRQLFRSNYFLEVSRYRAKHSFYDADVKVKIDQGRHLHPSSGADFDKGV